MTLFDMLKTTADKFPENLAISHKGEFVTYKKLLELSDSLANGISRLGLSKGSKIALMLPNCIQFAVAYFGSSKFGICLIPMNIMYKPDEARFILDDSSAEAIITIGMLRPVIDEIKDDLPLLKHIIMADNSAVENEINFKSLYESGSIENAFVSDNDCAVILYTSGTTGRPKGAMLSHKNLISNAKSCTEVLFVSKDDCFMSALPLFHSFGAMVFLILPIMVGAKIHLIDRFVPQSTIISLEQSDATIFGGVPSMFGLMIQTANKSAINLPRLRLCISGGSPLPPDISNVFDKLFKTVLVEGYGLTEASPVVSINPPFGINKAGSIGLPLPHVEVKILDYDMNELPIGEIGELAVRGENVMIGYLNKSDETSKTIYDGWLLTGDFAKLDEDGYIYVEGRKKELIIVGGMNVYPGEVERVIVEHPAVLEAAVFGIPNDIRGETVQAAVVLRPDMNVTTRELRLFCKNRLAAYKIPKGIEICENLPKNALGKVMRHILKDKKINNR